MQLFSQDVLWKTKNRQKWTPLVSIYSSHLVLRGRELLRVGEIVHGDGEEHVEQGVVAEQRQHDEVQRVDHAGPVQQTVGQLTVS